MYVPIDQVDVAESARSAPGGKPPQLQKLGTGEWARVKARVKASVEDMARRLLTLEAKRKSKTGARVLARYSVAEWSSKRHSSTRIRRIA